MDAKGRGERLRNLKYENFKHILIFTFIDKCSFR